MNALVLRLEAPLMSFGGPIVDNYGIVQTFPAVSLLAGLIGNALGYEHGEADKLNKLQERIRFAVRMDRPGHLIVDFQTVDLGQDFMCDTGWTTWGESEERGGGEARTGTHIRYRHYRADSRATVVLTLLPAGETPTLTDVEAALLEPVRPLFLGRKACLPSTPLLAGKVSAVSLFAALKAIPSSEERKVQAQWPADEGDIPGSRLVPVTDERDWANQIHAGGRIVHQGEIVLDGGTYV